jgi:hypothetical protein
VDQITIGDDHPGREILNLHSTRDTPGFWLDVESKRRQAGIGLIDKKWVLGLEQIRYSAVWL